MRASTLALAALLLAIAVPATPQVAASAYNIEIVVFRTDGGAGTGEAGGAPLESGGDVPVATGGVARLIGPLPASSLRLGDVVARLRAAAGYRPIAHAGWTQTASPWGSRSGFPLARVGVTAEGLSGMAYLERGQYLHLGFTMQLGRETISEIRRVRLNEKNYFDSSGFGVIALVTAAR